MVLSLAASAAGFGGVNSSPSPPVNGCAALSTACAKTKNCTLSTSISLSQSEYCAIEQDGHLEIAKGGQISCFSLYRFHGPICNISLAFTMGISLRPGTTLRASAVSLLSAKGHILVAPGSKIDTEGLGLCDYAPASPVLKHGTKQSGSQFTGAGHGGWGGACFGGLGSDGQPYGDGTAPLSNSPDARPSADLHEYSSFALDHFGSGSQNGGHTCCGGGLVKIRALSVHVGGDIIARGERPSDDCSTNCKALSGASGGTISVVALGRQASFNSTGVVDASGASAGKVGVCGGAGGAGGAGGRIELPYESYELWGSGEAGLMFISAAGGPSTLKSCQVGGAGSILFHDDDQNVLVFDSERQQAVAPSVIAIASSPHSRHLTRLEVVRGSHVVTSPGNGHVHNISTVIAASDAIRISINSIVELRPGQSLRTGGTLELLSGSCKPHSDSNR